MMEGYGPLGGLFTPGGVGTVVMLGTATGFRTSRSVTIGSPRYVTERESARKMSEMKMENTFDAQMERQRGRTGAVDAAGKAAESAVKEAGDAARKAAAAAMKE
jgi:hypothetical protein